MAGGMGYGGSTYTSQIYYIFNSLSHDLQQEKWKAEENIRTWEITLRFQIEEHVKEQKILLESYYNDRQTVLEKKRAEIIADAHSFYQQYDNTQLNNLIDQCKRLKFELPVAFLYEEKPISFILCVTKEHLAQIKKNESNTTKTGNYKSEAAIEIKNGRDSAKNKDSPTGAFRDSAFVTGQQNPWPSATPKPTNTYDHSASGSSGQNLQVSSNDVSDDKCPVCYMIYPAAMKLLERSQHVNEHY